MKQEHTSNKKGRLKHQPKGLTVLYEDQDIIVVNKEHRLLTVATDRERERTAHFLLNDYVKKGNSRSRNRVYVVHRLDRETSGVLIFAKNEKVKRALQEDWQHFHKTYFAVIKGRMSEKAGVMTSYLAENKAFKVYSVNDQNKGKYAKTGYETVSANKNYSLLDVTLFTGRKNQIRVHFAESGHPVAGDRSYGEQDKKINRLCLHAASLTIQHPFTKKEMRFEAEMPAYFSMLVK